MYCNEYIRFADELDKLEMEPETKAIYEPPQKLLRFYWFILFRY